jgi:hypothetical protein
MTRYEQITKGGIDEMSKIMAYCFIEFMEQERGLDFPRGYFRKFLQNEYSKDVKKWLMQEITE